MYPYTFPKNSLYVIWMPTLHVHRLYKNGGIWVLKWELDKIPKFFFNHSTIESYPWVQNFKVEFRELQRPCILIIKAGGT